MKSQLFGFAMLLGAVLASCTPKPKEVPAEQLALKIVPKPMSVQAGEGYFEVTPETKIYLTNESADLQKAADYLQGLFAQSAGFSPAIEQTDAPDTQKGIILGERGKMIRELGTRARVEIEKFLGQKVFLELFVKVRPKWRDNDLYLREYGYK